MPPNYPPLLLIRRLHLIPRSLLLLLFLPPLLLILLLVLILFVLPVLLLLLLLHFTQGAYAVLLEDDSEIIKEFYEQVSGTLHHTNPISHFPFPCESSS
jgi:hypothetical protein